MVSKTSTSVPASMAGYIAQLRRALFRLAEADPDDCVGVETLDDVGVVKAAALQLEQDKLSLVPGATIGPRSDALWRTLNIWTDAWTAHGIWAKKIEFHLVTNREITGIVKAFADEKRTANDDSQIAAALSAEYGDAKDGELQKLINKVLDKGTDVLSAVVNRIRLHAGHSEFDSVLVDATIGKLHLSPDLPDHLVVYERLLGWLIDCLIELWEAGKPGVISRQALDRQLLKITEKLNKARVTARAARFIDVTEDDLEDARKHRFLFHLASIQMSNEHVDQELFHYIRFSKEKLRLMSEGSVPPSEWIDRGGRLRDRWKYSRDKISLAATTQDDIQLGTLIFLEAAGHREPLDGNDMPEVYMTLGHYHRLADDDRVYWNPSFKPKGEK